MKQIHLAFYWHMHQPYYKDSPGGEYLLPWVRLHATRGYYDMVSILRDFPDVKQTFNLTPSLLKQIIDYADKGSTDSFLDHTMKPAGELEPQEKKFLLSNFFSSNWETMIRPHPGYWRLLQKRGTRTINAELDDVISDFSPQEYLDLQVWFNLSWFGYRASEKKEGIAELLKKGSGFSEEDKKYCMKIQRETLGEVISTYRNLQATGQIELTTSPFYHPILPLLWDSEFAGRSLPGAVLPESFHYPEDARAQIRKAIAFHKGIFGSAPEGMWPSEGAVCPEMIPALCDEGIRWIATDEEILLNSIDDGSREDVLYKPYLAGYDGKGVSVVFRDRALSDMIGFGYHNMPPEEAVEDFCQRLKTIRKGLVCIVLDGENPWESYPNSGRSFLTQLYTRLSCDKEVACVKIGDYLNDHPPVEKIESLYTGSWINHNLGVWIGSPEENMAWDCLSRTRRFLADYQKKGAVVCDSTNTGFRRLWRFLRDSKKKRDMNELAWDEIYMAEGSDWFWWYDDDFYTDYKAQFDHLFRMHLGNVFKILGKKIPEYLKNPIINLGAVSPTREPVGLISPQIDGVSDFFEWRAAGLYQARKAGGAMYKKESAITAIYYGFDMRNLYIRLDPCRETANGPVMIHLHIMAGINDYKILFPLGIRNEAENRFTLYRSMDGVSYEVVRWYATIAIKNIVELAVPFKDIGVSCNDRLNLSCRVERKKREIDRYPANGYLSFTVPDKDFEKKVWSV